MSVYLIARGPAPKRTGFLVVISSRGFFEVDHENGGYLRLSVPRVLYVCVYFYRVGEKSRYPEAGSKIYKSGFLGACGAINTSWTCVSGFWNFVFEKIVFKGHMLNLNCVVLNHRCEKIIKYKDRFL